MILYKYKIIYCILLIILLESKSSVAKDSLKVHIVGYFFNHNEQYKIIYKNQICTFKTVKGLNAFAFFIEIDDSMKNGDEIEMLITKKGRLQFKFHPIKLTPHYYNDRKYFILLRSYRLKNKYALLEHWSDKDPLGIIKDEFWIKNYIPSWAKCNCNKSQ